MKRMIKMESFEYEENILEENERKIYFHIDGLL